MSPPDEMMVDVTEDEKRRINAATGSKPMDSNKEIVKIQQALSAGKRFEESGLPDSMRSRWDEIDKEYKWFKANDLQMEVVNEWSDWSSETLEGLMTPWTKEALAELERDDDEEEDEEQAAKQ